MTQAPSGARYRATRRRLLIDMHIPDWDVGFLSRYRPEAIAEAAEATGAEAAMLYFQSHLGLCYYPTEVGVRHRCAAERDLAGEALAAVTAKGLASCAYYSVNFNNRAWLDHEDWRLEPAAPAAVGPLPRERYGIVCLNNRDYRRFVDAQIDEIVGYPVDAMFFDMMWWNGVCTCPSCRARYRDEEGAEIPITVDWRDAAWTRFQAARERWLAELSIELRARARAVRPELEVYHNFALGLSNWTRGVTFDAVAGHDFLGGDFYGGPAEQLLITRLMLGLSPKRPAEFMTTATTGLTDHVRLRSPAAMRRKALAAVMADAAFLAIVAIDPDGTVDAEALARVRAGFDAMRAFEGVGGEAIESVGLYCSDRSKMEADAPPRPLSEAPAASAPDYPHYHALVGACRILQRAHVPFGVVTRRDLDRLARWPVIVLPNIERLGDDEIESLRDYVAGGGKLYASRGAFLGAEVHGCRVEGVEDGRTLYVDVHGARSIAHPAKGVRRLVLEGGEALATLTLPYGYPHGGTVEDGKFASIHSSPPWRRTHRPLVVRNGGAIYSAVDLEAGGTPEHDALFLDLLRKLMPPPIISADTHPQIWLSAFAQPGLTTIMLLNYPPEEPALPVPSTRIRLRLPTGATCRAVRRGEVIDFAQDADIVSFDAGPIEEFAMIAVEHG